MASVITPTESRLITGEEFARMDHAERCELVKGRIVPMPPPPNSDHSRVEASISFALFAFVRENKLGHIGTGEGGVYTGLNPDTVRGADITFISNDRNAKRDPTKTYLDVGPDLIVEVLSPSNSMSEMMEKLREYFEIDVRLVWLVDPEPRRVYAYRSLTDVRTFNETDTITGDDVLPGFSVEVARFFENV